MSTLRSYDDPCGIARALDCVGERWALLIVRELLFGPKRYTDLRAGLPFASPNVLSQRLQELEACHVLHKRALSPPSGATVYELTPPGRELVDRGARRLRQHAFVQHLAGLKFLQALRQHVRAGQRQPGAQIGVALRAEQQLADDQQCPPFAHAVQRAGDAAGVVITSKGRHCVILKS